MTDAERESMELAATSRRLKEIADSLYRQAAAFEEKSRKLLVEARTETEAPVLPVSDTQASAS